MYKTAPGAFLFILSCNSQCRTAIFEYCLVDDDDTQSILAL